MNEKLPRRSNFSVTRLIALGFTLTSLPTSAASATDPLPTSRSAASRDSGFPPPVAWPANAIQPLTEERIGALPATEQAAWRAYLIASAERARRATNRDRHESPAASTTSVPPAGAARSQGVRLDAPAEWYTSEAARGIADRVAQWQTPAGGWKKTGDYSRAPVAADEQKDVWSAGTFDNDATVSELRYLALAIDASEQNSRSNVWRDAFQRGLDYVFAAQYPNGGFPQIYPLVGGYHDAITFNDDAIVHILKLLQDLASGQPPFRFVAPELAAVARERATRGLACVLAAQIEAANGERSVWCQQHDALTLKPCAARNYEPISASSAESAGLVQLLMSLPQPTADIAAAIDGAMKWFENRALREVIWDRTATRGSGLVTTPGAPDSWARFYDIETGRPIFGDRDRSIHFTVTEISEERRRGYAWYTTRPATLHAKYLVWQKQHTVPRRLP